MKYVLALMIAGSAALALARSAPAHLELVPEPESASAVRAAQPELDDRHGAMDEVLGANPHSLGAEHAAAEACPASIGAANESSSYEPSAAHPWDSSRGSLQTSDALVKAVQRSTARNGRTVAEIFARRTEERDRALRVRGVVVKRTEGILGKTYLHLQDGSGSQAASDHDLTVISEDSFTLGEVVEVEGLLQLDADPGIGHRYPVLLADARRVPAE